MMFSDLKTSIRAATFAFLFLCGTSALIADSAKALNPLDKENVGKEIVVRESSEAQADALAKKAVAAYSKGDYKESIDLYLAAIEKLNDCGPASDYVKGKIEECKRAISKVYYAWSQKIAADAERPPAPATSTTP
jgi:hypothetical protein